MIKVILGNTLSRKEVIVDPSRTLRSVLEENNIDYSRGQMNLDGSPVGLGGLDKTFAELGITTRCFLLNVVKADNA